MKRLWIDDSNTVLCHADLVADWQRAIQDDQLESTTTLADYIHDCCRCGLTELDVCEKTCAEIVSIYSPEQGNSIFNLFDDGWDVIPSRDNMSAAAAQGIDQLLLTSDDYSAIIVTDIENWETVY